MVDLQNNITKLALDTNLFVYFFDKNSSFYPAADILFRDIAANNKRIITSTITLTELLSFKNIPAAALKRLENSLRSIPELSIVDVSQEVALEAARVRRKYGFRLADSIQLATAMCVKAQIFITNDEGLKKFQETEVKLLKEFT